MNRIMRRIVIVFSIFLFLCTVINFANGHIGAAIGGLGAGVFYLCLSLAAEKQKSNGSKQ